LLKVEVGLFPAGKKYINYANRSLNYLLNSVHHRIF
jgi:hypothetical protein